MTFELFCIHVCSCFSRCVIMWIIHLSVKCFLLQINYATVECFFLQIPNAIVKCFLLRINYAIVNSCLHLVVQGCLKLNPWCTRGSCEFSICKMINFCNVSYICIIFENFVYKDKAKLEFGHPIPSQLQRQVWIENAKKSKTYMGKWDWQSNSM